MGAAKEVYGSPAIGEAKARYNISWLVDEASVAVNHGGSSLMEEEGDSGRQILELCEMHPCLALEYFVLQGTGEKVGLLEAFLRNRFAPYFVMDFCQKFPDALKVKSFAGETYPLHVACEELFHDDRRILIPFLAEAFPEAVSTCDADGNLPLHKLLKRLAMRPSLAVENQEVPEVEALVQSFPESTITRGMDLAGQDPLHFAFSHHLSPAAMKSILSYIPATVSQFATTDSYFSGGMASITRNYAEAFQKFFPQLECLEFKPRSPAEIPVFSPEGWVVFIAHLVCCPLLADLTLELPYPLLREDSQSYTAFLNTLPQLTGLRSLILSFPKGAMSVRPKDDVEVEALLSKPISELVKAKGGRLKSLIVKNGIAMNPVPILQAIIDRPESPLLSLDIRSCSGDMTQSLAALIAMNGNLESLFVNNTKVQPKPILQALVHNSKLKSLALPNLIIEECVVSKAEDQSTATLSSVLQHYNTTLERIQCLEISYHESNCEEYQRIQHYASLNRFGRAKAEEETSNGEDIIELLVAVDQNTNLKHRGKAKASICYGLLREAPAQWTSGHLLG